VSTPLRRYYRGHDLVGLRDEVNASTRYYRFDHQGTTQCLTDQAGTVTDRFAADAWGVPVKRTGSSINRQWYVGNWGYYRQVDRLLDYVRARNTQPDMGRWMTKDPAGEDSDRSLYAYALNSPVLRVDPSGLRIGDCFCDRDTLERMWKEAQAKPCGQICDLARKSPYIYKGGGGGVICYWGKKCSCLFSLNDPRGNPLVSPGTCPSLDKCALAHEDAHKPEIDCDPTCGLRRPPVRDPKKPNANECKHRKAQLACLEQIPLRSLSSQCFNLWAGQHSNLSGWIDACCDPSKPKPNGYQVF